MRRQPACSIATPIGGPARLPIFGFGKNRHHADGHRHVLGPDFLFAGGRSSDARPSPLQITYAECRTLERRQGKSIQIREGTAGLCQSPGVKLERSRFISFASKTRIHFMIALSNQAKAFHNRSVIALKRFLFFCRGAPAARTDRAVARAVAGSTGNLS